MQTALRIENLWKSYSAGVRGCSARVWALRGCSFTLGSAERIAIVGARASGKSTLLRCIAGELRPDAGTVERNPACRVQLVDESHDWPVNLAGCALIITSRDAARVHPFVDRIFMLRDGRLEPLTRLAVRRVAELPPRVASF